MTKLQKKFIATSAILALAFGLMPAASAMHIMEGFLSPTYCILWGVVSIPFVVAGLCAIRNTLKEHPRAITMFAMAGAFIFVISSLKIPSVTGSCSHMTGTGLGAIILGPAAVSVLGLIVLLFQAILLAHGGVTTLGANLFSMAIAGPFITFGIYILCKKLSVNKKLSIFLAAALGDFVTYCITSAQLALAYPSESGGVVASLVKFLSVFAPTQIPLAILEGILTVLIIIALETYAKPELRLTGYLKEGN